MNHSTWWLVAVIGIVGVLLLLGRRVRRSTPAEAVAEGIVMQRTDWLLLGLAAANGKPLTPVQLQKLLFLLREAKPDIGENELYEFVPYHYGPFDSTIYSDAEQLSQQGLVTIDRNPSLRRYAITPAGMAKAAELRGRAPAGAVSYLTSLVEWILPLNFTQLVKAIYDKYPQYRQNSVFQG